MVAGAAEPSSSKPWLPLPTDIVVLSIGLLAMFSLTLQDLFRDNEAGLWAKDAHSHGPIMLAVAMWLLTTRWREFKGTTGPATGSMLAWPVFAIGSAFYVLGRALGIIYFEVFAFIPMMAGMVLLSGGTPLLSKLKFPLFFLIFMVPIPGFVLDPFSQFIKLYISTAVTNILWFFGYPISHTGVVINIGPYQLLVADACAGMRTLFMLEAMGIFYLNVARHSSAMRNVTLGLLIVPISFTSNMMRVIFLALLTYHFGDEVGQGFLHGFAGAVLFLVGLGLITSLDALLRWISSPFAKPQE
ncbi:exosortase B [Aquabacterium sp.]|uniref:exosortase B n=1 Tax=Aquabacterium sp. TaxID=1872578 RepID=UPI0019C16E9A|nr:exosortase B [Aquabacterium sp.]MBC7701832.1 exosortase B [Aquabacterium sp.]